MGWEASDGHFTKAAARPLLPVSVRIGAVPRLVETGHGTNPLARERAGRGPEPVAMAALTN
jgi:hypothetical protein